MATTRSKSSSSEKVNRDGDYVPLTLVKELMKTQELTMKSFFTSFVENTNKRIDKLTEEVQGIIASLEFTQAELKDLKKASSQLAETTNKHHKDVECAVGRSDKNIDEIREKIKELENKTGDIENRTRRNNLCFDGIKEGVKESYSESERKIRDLLSSKFSISTDEFSIERAHRMGRSESASKHRQIVTKFQNLKTKEAILKNKKYLKGTNMFVREDFSEKILAKRKELLPKMHEERRKGNFAFLRYDKLVTYPRRDRDFTGPASPYSPFVPAGRGRGSGRGSPLRPGKDWECPHTVDNS